MRPRSVAASRHSACEATRPATTSPKRDSCDRRPACARSSRSRGRRGRSFAPASDGIVKLATESFTREIRAEELFASLVAPNVRGVRARCVKTIPCLYTATPDFHFVIDRHPAMERVIVASPCSGHGFKHSAAIGEALAQLATGGRTALDLSAFRFPG